MLTQRRTDTRHSSPSRRAGRRASLATARHTRPPRCSRIERESPDVGQELRPRAHIPAPRHQVLQERGLTLRHPTGPAPVSATRRRGSSVTSPTRDMPFLGTRARLPQTRPNPRDQLRQSERLRQVVGRTELQATDLLLHIRKGGQDQHPLLGRSSIRRRRSVTPSIPGSRRSSTTSSYRPVRARSKPADAVLRAVHAEPLPR